MEHVAIVLDGTEQPEPELQHKKIHSARIQKIIGMPNGMDSGRASVAFLIHLEDGSVVFAETSLRLLQHATTALTGKYGSE